MTEACLNPNIGQLLAAYELGLLSKGETIAFETHIHDCSGCLVELYNHSDYVTAIHEDTERLLLELPFDDARSGYNDGRPVRLSHSGPRLIERWRRRLSELIPNPVLLPAGITTVAVVVLGVLLHVSGNERNFDDLAQIAPLDYVRLETRSDLQEDLDLGFSFYAEEVYGQAIVHLERALETEREFGVYKRSQIHLYIGVAYLLSGHRTEAYSHLKTASDSPLPVISDRAHWYLGQASLQDENPQKAVLYLRELAGKSPAYGEKAESLLVEIEKIMDAQSR